MEIVHDPESGSFATVVDGHRAFLGYRLEGGRMSILTTQVPPPIERRGIGSALVEAAVREAESRGWQVIPVCGFARSWLERHRPPDAP